jgi:hypothetical protein
MENSPSARYLTYPHSPEAEIGIFLREYLENSDSLVAFQQNAGLFHRVIHILWKREFPKFDAELPGATQYGGSASLTPNGDVGRK